MKRPRHAPVALRWLVIACLCLPTVTASGAETVILVQPTMATTAVRQCLVRIRDELSADRFRVLLAEANPKGDPGAFTVDPNETIDAVVGVFGAPETGQAELILFFRNGRRSAVRRAIVIAEHPDRMPETLAARTLELLHATGLELSVGKDGGPRSPAEIERGAHLTQSPATPPPVDPDIATIDLGLGVWKSLHGPSAAVTPIGRAGLRLSDRVGLRAAFVGLGTLPRVRTSYGSATVSQSLALVEIVAGSRKGGRMRPTASLGAGVFHVAVSGSGAGPYEGRESTQWSAAIDAGMGAEIRVGSRMALATEFHTQVASPRPVVRFMDTRASTLGYPALMLTVCLRVAP